MRTNVLVASAACVAAMAGWWARGIEWAPIDSASPAPLQRASIASRNDAVALAVNTHHAQPRELHPSRNLFAYRAAPPLVQRAIHVAPPPAEIARVAVAPAPAIESKPRLQFRARYIGRFGPERNPIAAFVRDGQVTTVRIGERIDEHFVLRRIGWESVEVQARDGEDVVTQQLPLG
ncbi:MAG TPA: hypothetical protein VHW00_10920 [Thermoanaerobaculia bacterium]|nr:hypothetical protein [Thermoanaerobaculia bacterium]